MEFRKNLPIYVQIADYLLESILSGSLTPGDKIPSVREQASSIEVNPNTVMRTYSYLQDQGIIQNKRGIGYFVTDSAEKIIDDMKKTDFINDYLPELFKTMEMLKIDFKQLEKYYQTHKAKQNENK